MNLRRLPNSERLLCGLEGVASNLAGWTAREKGLLIRTERFSIFLEHT